MTKNRVAVSEIRSNAYKYVTTPSGRYENENVDDPKYVSRTKYVIFIRIDFHAVFRLCRLCADGLLEFTVYICSLQFTVYCLCADGLLKYTADTSRERARRNKRRII